MTTAPPRQMAVRPLAALREVEPRALPRLEGLPVAAVAVLRAERLGARTVAARPVAPLVEQRAETALAGRPAARRVGRGEAPRVEWLAGAEVAQ